MCTRGRDGGGVRALYTVSDSTSDSVSSCAAPALLCRRVWPRGSPLHRRPMGPEPLNAARNIAPFVAHICL